MAGDLHIHTTFSDGSTPAQMIPKIAALTGLEYIAITDHDTTLAIEYAQKNKSVHGVELIPAVELSCEDKRTGNKVHLLCYFAQASKELCSFEQLMRKRRNDVAQKTIEVLQKEYKNVDFNEVYKYAEHSKVTFRTHPMRLLNELGYTKSIHGELNYKLYNDETGLAPFVPQYSDINDVLEIIKSTGGVCVVAHPSVYKSVELCKELAAAGKIDGLEINHPRNTEDDKKELLKIAQQYNLIITGGTDFHGLHMQTPLPIGTCTTAKEQIEKMRALAQKRKA